MSTGIVHKEVFSVAVTNAQSKKNSLHVQVEAKNDADAGNVAEGPGSDLCCGEAAERIGLSSSALSSVPPHNESVTHTSRHVADISFVSGASLVGSKTVRGQKTTGNAPCPPR